MTKTKDSWARPHQRDAINDILKGFKKHDRGQCIMACGTGKTRVALRVAEKLNSRLTLIMVPSISLIGQVIREWRQFYDGQLSILGICSDRTTSARGEDRDDMSAAQLEQETGIVVTTDSTVVAAFMRGRGDRVVVCTYHSSETLELAQLRRSVPAFDFAIIDEAHRTAGDLNSTFATVVREDNIRATKRLFMTATPRIFGASGQSETIEVSSMDDVEMYGPVFHRLGFAAAVARGLLVNWQAVVSIVYDDEVAKMIKKKRHVNVGKQRFNARDVALHIALNKAIIKERLKKVITFHSRVPKAKNFADVHNLLTLQFPKPLRVKNQWIRHVSAYQNSLERLAIQNEFAAIKRDTTAILTNAQCLTEGVDIPAVDAVMFSDPKHSVIAIVQAVGRAMRISTGKNQGLIVIPVFVRGRSNGCVHAQGQKVWDQVMDRTEFKVVRNVLMALRSSDDLFGAAMSNVSRRSGSNSGARIVTADESEPGIRGQNMVEAPSDGNVIVRVKDGKAFDAEGREVVVTLPKNLSIVGVSGGRVGKNFMKAIVNRTVRWTVDSEEDRARQIVDFITKNGRYPHCNKGYREKRLSVWISEFRKRHRNFDIMGDSTDVV